MRYLMKQKIFCLGDDFAIKDEHGRDVAYVDGRVFTLRKTLDFLDGRGNRIAQIVKRIISLGPVYDLYRGDQIVATISKNLFTLFRCKFTVDVPGPNDYEAQGSFHEHDYCFVRGGREVAHVSKKWFSLADSYGVEIDPREDHLLVLASTAVIDLCCHDEQGHK